MFVVSERRLSSLSPRLPFHTSTPVSFVPLQFTGDTGTETHWASKHESEILEFYSSFDGIIDPYFMSVEILI